MRIDNRSARDRPGQRHFLEDPHALALDAQALHAEARDRGGGRAVIALAVLPRKDLGREAELLPRHHLEGREHGAAFARGGDDQDGGPLHRGEAAAGQVLEIRARNDGRRIEPGRSERRHERAKPTSHRLAIEVHACLPSESAADEAPRSTSRATPPWARKFWICRTTWPA